jgi:hypothetical protein
MDLPASPNNMGHFCPLGIILAFQGNETLLKTPVYRNLSLFITASASFSAA